MGSSTLALVDDGAYDDIRAMLATIEATGWTSLTQTAVAPDMKPPTGSPPNQLGIDRLP
jgi:hypothetical protein